MKFGNFLFPDCRDPARDGVVIDETLREAWLSDELGVDVIWLAEHHFDGICAYVDPISFAGALATSTRRSKIGFAVVQTALHHPIRLAEQLAVLDNITKGRLVVGLGRGSSYNIYDYQGFGIDHHEAQERLEEAEKILVTAWTGEGFSHHGKFWNLDVPMLRPRPYTKPHPALVRAASGEASMLELARQGRPFLMNVQSMAVTRQRVELLPQGDARSGLRRGADRAQPRGVLGVAECVCRRDRRRSRARRGAGLSGNGRGAGGAAQPDLSRDRHAHRGAGERSALRPRHASSTASSTARRRGSPRRWRISTSSASAASSRPSASGRCRTRRRPTASGCSWSRSHRKFAAALPARAAATNPPGSAAFSVSSPSRSMRRPGAVEARFEHGGEVLVHVKILRTGRFGGGQRLGHSAADDRFDDVAEQCQLSTVDSIAQRRDRAYSPRCLPLASRASGRCRCRCRSDAPCSRPARLRAPPIPRRSSRDRPAAGPYAR